MLEWLLTIQQNTRKAGGKAEEHVQSRIRNKLHLSVSANVSSRMLYSHVKAHLPSGHHAQTCVDFIIGIREMLGTDRKFVHPTPEALPNRNPNHLNRNSGLRHFFRPSPVFIIVSSSRIDSMAHNWAAERRTLPASLRDWDLDTSPATVSKSQRSET